VLVEIPYNRKLSIGIGICTILSDTIAYTYRTIHLVLSGGEETEQNIVPAAHQIDVNSGQALSVRKLCQIHLTPAAQNNLQH
jgi:hypothetical protein